MRDVIQTAGLVALIGTLIFLTGCQSQQTYTLEQFQTDLRAYNATVSYNGTTDTDILNGEKHMLTVNNEYVQVWQFRSDSTAAHERARIGADGSSIRTRGGMMMVDWIAPPHWYSKGSIIVLYNGNNTPLLETVLSTQFAPTDQNSR